MKKSLLSFMCIWIALTIQAAATSGSCGTNATWDYDELYHLLSIEGTGAMKDYKSSSLPPWHQYKDEIKIIYIEEGITELGQYAFWECENVEYVDIPLSLERIGMNAFAHCKKLDDVVVYNNLTTIEGQAFLFCESLTSFIVPNSVTNFGSTIFQGCKTLSNIVLPKNLKSIPYHTFYNCWALTQVDIPSTVESIGEAAFFNSGITSLQLPANLKKIEACAFKGCDDIISLVVPDKVTEIGNEFVQDCNSLLTVTIGQSVSKIGYNAFQSCDVLSKVIFKPTTPPTLNMTNNFKNVPSSIKIEVPCGSLSAYQTAYANQNGISSSNFQEDCNTTPQIISYKPNWVEIRYYPSYGFHSLDMFIVDNTNATSELLRILFYPDALHYVSGFYWTIDGSVVINSTYDGYYVAANSSWSELETAAFTIRFKQNKSNGDKVYHIDGYCELVNGTLVSFNFDKEIISSTVNVVNGEWQYSNYSLYDTVETIETIEEDNCSQKILRDGQILIIRGDKTYTLTGQEVR